MECPFCKRDKEHRPLKDGKVRCMSCGWKWENDLTKPHIKLSTRWKVVSAPSSDELNDKAEKFAEKLNDASRREYSWRFVFPRKRRA